MEIETTLRSDPFTTFLRGAPAPAKTGPPMPPVRGGAISILGDAIFATSASMRRIEARFRTRAVRMPALAKIVSRQLKSILPTAAAALMIMVVAAIDWFLSLGRAAPLLCALILLIAATHLGRATVFILSSFSFAVIFAAGLTGRDSGFDTYAGAETVFTLLAFCGTAMVAAAMLRSRRDMSAQAAQLELSRLDLDRTRDQLFHVTRVQTLADLAASIAHEVNQPVSAVVSNGEACLNWLARGTPHIQEVRYSVEKMIAGGRRASDILTRLRALACRSTPALTVFSARDLVDEVALIFKSELADGLVSLRIDICEDLPAVRADRVALQQVLINLMVNGVQALASVEDEPKELIIRALAADDGPGLVVEIRDNGPGFGQAEPERLFDAYYTTKTGGMGMGLSICRSIVEMHGGRISARNGVDGRGACFTIELPCNNGSDVAP